MVNMESIMSFSHSTFQTMEGMLGAVIAVTASGIHSKQFVAILDTAGGAYDAPLLPEAS